MMGHLELEKVNVSMSLLVLGYGGKTLKSLNPKYITNFVLKCGVDFLKTSEITHGRWFHIAIPEYPACELKGKIG